MSMPGSWEHGTLGRIADQLFCLTVDERNRDVAIVNDLLLILVVADVCGAINGDRFTLLNDKPI